MMVGYARVSTRRQNPDLQIDALQKAGCRLIIVEKISGRAKHKRGLAAAIASCAAGDTLTVWKLDRLGRDALELIGLIRLLASRRMDLRILSGRESLIDIGTGEGRALYALYATFADFEQGFGIDRSRAGVAAARLRKTQLRRLPGHTGPIRSEVGEHLRFVFNRSR